MTVVREVHEDHGATFTEVGGHVIAAQYGRPERAHHAVRRVVGVTEHPYGVLVVTGPDREQLLRSLPTKDTPTEDGQGTYYLHRDERERIVAEAYLYHAGERLLCFAAPGTETLLAEAWRSRASEADLSVEVSLSSSAFGVFGIHGPKATEKVASVLTGPGAPDGRFSFVRGQVGDNGVTVIRTDDLAGEESYEVVSRAADADRVFDALLNHGLNAAPFGHDTWKTLTLEAGTPLFESELLGHQPTALGLSHLTPEPSATDTGRLVGLRPTEVPEAGTALAVDGTQVGTVTRAARTPTLDGPAALASLDDRGVETVMLEERSVPVSELPLVEGSGRSVRLPR